MFNDVYEEMSKIVSKKRRVATPTLIELNLIPLFILKYLCDNNIYSYKEIVQLSSLENFEIKFEDYPIIFDDFKINKLLPLIQYDDITSLVKEYLNTLNTGISIIDSNKKKVCISTGYATSMYDISGNTTYVTDKFGIEIRKLCWFKFFDKVLNVNNDYIEFKDLDITKYNKLYFYDFAPKYLFIRNSDNDLYDLMRKLLFRNRDLDIILHTSYKKISNMNNAWYLLKYLNVVVLYDEYNTFLRFRHKDNNEISIINYDKIKNKSISKLHEIIKNNRRQKDVLTKTTVDEIKKNHYRIGFRLYQDKLTRDVSNINDIVSENTRLVGRLSSLNSQIEIEINRLINR